MYKLFERRLNAFINAGQERVLGQGYMGLEKEALRVGVDGKIAQTPHPQALGSALTHPFITTDFSEALVELITPYFSDVKDTLAHLKNTQKFVYSHLDHEILWMASMPCVVEGEQSIPIAQYGSSNAGMMKTVYRRGLGLRYGKMMQVIAGVHFNYSFSQTFWQVFYTLEGTGESLQDFISNRYFALIRNLQRVGWLIPYLFGASPAVCKSFLNGVTGKLQPINGGTYYDPHATSLRMSDIGYQNTQKDRLGFKACYDSLDAYIKSLSCAMQTVEPLYAAMGTQCDGVYQQLNANVLQIENEYYSSVRPKQTPKAHESPMAALRKRGVQYVELRSLDVNIFEPLGVAEDQLRFLELFMLFCLLHESPILTALERAEIDYNQMIVARKGRQRDLQLRRQGYAISLQQWAMEICQWMTGLADVLGGNVGHAGYHQTLEQQRAVIAAPERTLSAKISAIIEREAINFFELAMEKSKAHRDFFNTFSLSEQTRRQYAILAEQSLDTQGKMEAADELSFDEYLDAYLQGMLPCKDVVVGDD